MIKLNFLTSFQARKTEKLSKTFSPVDEAADERLKKEAQDEEMSIKSTCDELGVKIHEVSLLFMITTRGIISSYRFLQMDTVYSHL